MEHPRCKTLTRCGQCSGGNRSPRGPLCADTEGTTENAGARCGRVGAGDRSSQSTQRRQRGKIRPPLSTNARRLLGGLTSVCLSSRASTQLVIRTAHSRFLSFSCASDGNSHGELNVKSYYLVALLSSSCRRKTKTVKLQSAVLVL